MATTVDTSGRCNCGSITVTLAKEPTQTVMCHCFNCRRAGGPASINYVLADEEITVNDAQGTLKTYADHDTASGNVCMRSFCGNCGSPIYSVAVGAPGKKFLKTSLFENVSTNKFDFFTQRLITWA
ncbi:glutathione-dependent formaldehyde-activating enzyme domain-containing protein [Purpureocillium lilacinum]|uniref:Glutathione-dependent formaldehyde-activating enzyme domain-containing protein n=1 Tax=Purpureocillium lilacinum TaxID=33203 RepID=A0A179GT80_PURLI|nr:glutathione-dependent formaldehyde-activating enzyme domain-containing protein [Purpureocillium lilacinum]OAQ75841.1 glutathione-dependent formaldehyde-activating enzyme domain-containing protein [Purpureocillium lilacinum]OAQ80503.1 glutathione-dependent formaldehyde-activating enzyme domain-containing protein [Purpureocillium lilacinum]GJN75018.1 hypothetical protein PLICBS_009114 [Purpureocillium lilacinum]GJN85248.1 hypothetical protein PLIIFM63780_008812 [Purpureocillium lilacinum]